MSERKWLSYLFGDKKSFIILLIIILAGIALRMYCYRGFWGTDDGEYARLANAMVQGNFNDFVQENYIRNFYAPAHLPYRMGLIYPLSLLVHFFGVTEMALSFYPLMIAVLGITLAFVCGRILFSISSGLIAAVIWAVLPVDVRFATSFLPDIIASFYASLGVLIIIFIIQANIEKRTIIFFLGLIGGLSFGMSWLSKESLVYLVPFCIFLFFISMWKDWKKAVPLWAGVAIASLGVLFTEMAVYYYTKGDFMLRMHENERSFVQTRSYLFYEGSRFGWPEGGSRLKALLKRLFLDGPSTVFLNPDFLFLPFWGFIASAHAVYWRDRQFLIPSVWMFSLFFMYNFASCSSASYTPLVLLERYLHPIILPAAVLTSGFIVRLFTHKIDEREGGMAKERSFWGMMIIVTVLTTSLYYSFRQVRDMSGVRPIYEIRSIASIIKPTDRVYTDPLSRKALEFYWRYPGKMNVFNFEGMRAEEIETNSFILVDKFRMDWLKINVSMWLTKDYGYNKPEFFSNPPDTWKKVWSNNYINLYKVE